MRSLRLAFGLAALVAVAAHAQAPAQPESQSFKIVEVADGVYAGIGLNGVFGNGAFIVNRDNVLVVDTQERPSWARDFIADIRAVTPKPVHYVVNTHFHRDHSQGNQAYVEAFGPDVEIIAQDTAREDMLTENAEILSNRRRSSCRTRLRNSKRLSPTERTRRAIHLRRTTVRASSTKSRC
jgi:cyclase